MRITLARLVWAHLDPDEAAPFFEHDSDCVRGQSVDDMPTTYLYRGRFLFTVAVSNGVSFLDAPPESLAS